MSETCPAPPVPGDFGSGAERGTIVVLGGTAGAPAPRSGAGRDAEGAELVCACQGARPCWAAAGNAPKRTLKTAVIGCQWGRWRFAMALPTPPESCPDRSMSVGRH